MKWIYWITDRMRWLDKIIAVYVVGHVLYRSSSDKWLMIEDPYCKVRFYTLPYYCQDAVYNTHKFFEKMFG